MPEMNRLVDKSGGYAASDMLHRRIALPYSELFVLKVLPIRVKTDSALITEALRLLGASTVQANLAAISEWEIAVESGETKLPNSDADSGDLEVVHFGPSRAIRTNDGSWFAHTPPSTNGVGFAVVRGSQRDQVNHLADYIQTVALFLEDFATQQAPNQEFEVVA